MLTERVDDIPLLLAELEKSELSTYLSQYFPDHGNWSGLSGGKVSLVFLTFILSCNDHRLHRLEPWAATRLQTLSHCLGVKELSSKDFTDDRLGLLLDHYSDQDKWDEFESAHNKNMLHVYQLGSKPEPIRLDAMIVQSFRESDEDFKKGHSKQHRADLPQLKVMVATLDPLAMPLSSVIVSGNQADDGLYLEVVKKLSQDQFNKGQLFVGDAKLGNLANRAYLQNQGQYYLCPLSKKQCSTAQLSRYLEDQPHQLVEVFEQQTSIDQPMVIKAKAFEQQTKMYSEQFDLEWTERRVVVYSQAYADTLYHKLEQRIETVRLALTTFLEAKQGKKKMDNKIEIELEVSRLLKKHKMEAFIHVDVEEQTQLVKVRKYRDRPARNSEKISFSLHIQTDQEALEKHRQQLGWRVYATNSPIEQLSTKEAIICYRQEYRIEHKFNELLHKFTALAPLYLKKSSRIKALVRLCLLALKFVSAIEYQVRKELNETKEQLDQIYPANPGRKTSRPTTKMILEAFQNISLVIIPIQGHTIIKINNLKPIQNKLLALLKINPVTYSQLEQIPFSDFNFSET